METEIKGIVGFPSSYFWDAAQRDYYNYKSALPREFYQNSIDATAKNIRVSFDMEKRTIAVLDDGFGMNFDILKDKLLMFGGSHKPEGGTGAFGEAKKLLLFAWKSYLLHTSGFWVAGSGAQYTIKKAPMFLKGTKVIIEIQEDVDLESLKNAFQIIARKMQTSTRIYVDDELQECNERRGRLVKSLEWANIYQTKSIDDSSAAVRVNGIWMFNRYVGEGHGKLIIELMKYSREILTSNRDGLKSDYSRQMDILVADLLVNKKSALKNHDKKTIEIKGAGAITVISQEIMESILKRCMEPCVCLEFNVGSALAKEFEHAVKEFKSGAISEEALQRQLEFIGYEPDFILEFSGRKEGRISKFMKTRRARVMAKMWTEVLKLILFDIGQYITFTAGFCFDFEENAEFMKKDGKIYFLFNPFNIHHKLKIESILAHRALVARYIRQKAYHEVAHLFYEDHNENFIAKCADIEITTWKYEDKYAKLAKISA